MSSETHDACCRSLGSNRTNEYQQLQASGSRDFLAELHPKLQGRTLVLVPGFLSDPMRRGIYFAKHVGAFSSLTGVTVKMPAFNSEAAPLTNALAIAKQIDAYGHRDARDIVLLTHSKGSLDTLRLLIERPDLRQRVAGWVSLQGAILGSPIATFAADDPLFGPHVRVVLDKFLKGEPAGIESLRTLDAEGYVHERVTCGDLKTLANDVKMLFYGSSADGSFLLDVFRRAMKDPNDGLMPMANTFLPFAPYVAEPGGPDHAAAVMPGWPIGFDDVRLASVLLGMCL